MSPRTNRTWVEVSQQALLANVAAFEGIFQDKAKIAPVIKANAYGHGMAWAAQTLRKTQIWGFCVAYGSEALDLQGLTGNKPILVLSSWEDGELPELIRRKVRIVAWDVNALRRVATASRKLGIKAFVHVKIDTGTSRLGTGTPDVPSLVRTLASFPEIYVEGIFSHFADSEAASLTFARQQQNAFAEITKHTTSRLRHMACTAAALRLPLQNTNLIRLGIGTYGLWPSDETRRTRRVRLQPVLSWKTHVLQAKEILPGATVGYDRTFTARRKMKLAILPVGYSDGYDRLASNTSSVVIRGTRCPVVGRVSMNLTITDASRVRTLRPGDTVELIGPTNPADELANDWSTINYEVVSRIHPSIPRIAVR